jgi:hypothetical protein
MSRAEHLAQADKYLAEAERQYYREQKPDRASALAALAAAHYAAAQTAEVTR